MDYRKILKTLCEAEGVKETDDLETYDDDMIPELPEEPVEDEEVIDEPVEETEPIVVGSQVVVIDGSIYTAEELGLDNDEFELFIDKTDMNETAVVFDEDDDNPDLVDIVFEDGLEIFNIAKTNLEIFEPEAIEPEEVPVEDDFGGEGYGTTEEFDLTQKV